MARRGGGQRDARRRVRTSTCSRWMTAAGHCINLAQPPQHGMTIIITTIATLVSPCSMKCASFTRVCAGNLVAVPGTPDGTQKQNKQKGETIQTQGGHGGEDAFARHGNRTNVVAAIVQALAPASS